MVAVKCSDYLLVKTEMTGKLAVHRIDGFR